MSILSAKSSASANGRLSSKMRTLGFAVLCALGLFWDGIPLIWLGIPIPTSRYLVGVIVLGFFLISILYRTTQSGPWSIWEGIPLAFIGWILFVSIISSNSFYPQPIAGWLFALYSILPLLLVFMLRTTGSTAEDIVTAINMTSLFVCILIWISFLTSFDILSDYQRAATTDVGLERIVVYKTQISLAAGVYFQRTVAANRIFRILSNGLIFVFLFSTLAIIVESRLTLAAVLLAIFSYVVIFVRGRRKYLLLSGGSLLSLVFFPIFLGKYVEQFLRYDNYISDDQSIQWRLLTARYYNDIFDNTMGFGFGIMSSGEGRDNPFSFAQHRAGELFDGYGYNLYLADTGILGALFQFGYVGILFVAGMSLIVSYSLISTGYGKSTTEKDVAVIGLVVLFYVVSPWPTNFFSLEWSVGVGGYIWALAAASSSARSRRPIH
ncbi:O-antigen ligase family protein [Pannonibacter sp. I15F10I1]|uniref:O-antigen ligase family protein n=1 Tax=Pannonibacter sp. I15F10I1 TaxID=2003580 RepID=UPI001644A1B2|nr:O-antigen ligase family protein [Pannonibacter sp. I15F10I1]